MVSRNRTFAFLDLQQHVSCPTVAKVDSMVS